MDRWLTPQKHGKAARQPIIHALERYRQVQGAADVLRWVFEGFENRFMITSTDSFPHTLFGISDLTQLLIPSNIHSKRSFKLIFLDILGSVLGPLVFGWL